MKRVSVLWESRTPVVAECFRAGRILSAANGGNAYDAQAAWALATVHDVLVSEASFRRNGESVWQHWLRMRRLRYHADVLVREPFAIAFGRFVRGAKHIGVVHHIDRVISKKSFWHRWYFSRLKKRLTAMDLVVTVSGHWAEFLRSLGCKQVKVIYNSFDPSFYQPAASKVAEFRKANGLPDDRPVVYIGNASRQKGVHAVYAALKDTGYHLVMSGPQNRAVDLPVQYFQLEREDYVLLLHCCDAVVCMSEMEEGWNRIAHEAMLCAVPVAGNGAGGMRELLEGGHQAVVGSVSELVSVLPRMIAEKEHVGETGRRFASAFDLDYFRSAWLEAVESLLNGGTG
jgi:glycosyltransferase involved in cell wall biosynthesis